MERTRPSHLTRLAPEVLAYENAALVLGEELYRLDAVSRAEAPEAVVFYCGRILEALSADALCKIRLQPSPNSFSNLNLLGDLGRFTTATRYWAHALRRLGNAVRHLQRRIGFQEAKLSGLLTERWLAWYFCDYSHGPKLNGLTTDGTPLELISAGDMRQAMLYLEELEAAPSRGPADAVAQDFDSSPAFKTTAVLPALLAEILLSQKKDTDALRVLEAAMPQFPDDLRLRQLTGLCWSRMHNPDEALHWLEGLYPRFADDEETAGITAGTWKRKWQENKANLESLENSHRLYQHGWSVSGSKNAYLGINAATTALLLGRGEQAISLAAAVEKLIRNRAADLPADLHDPHLALHFWDQVTLAEAQLLQGDLAGARETYRAAFAGHPERLGDIEVCRKQIDEILNAQKYQKGIGEFA